MNNIRFNGIYIDKKYIFDKELNSNEKILLGLITYANKYYSDDLITSQYLEYMEKLDLQIFTENFPKKSAKLFSNIDIDYLLEKDNYIKISMQYHKKTEIKLGKKIEVV